MSDSNPSPVEEPVLFAEQSAPVRILIPPKDRLFAVFDDDASAAAAVRALQAEGLSPENDVWVFRGEEGARGMDVSGASHGLWGRLVRLVETALCDDVDYLRRLGSELERKHIVLAVRATSGRKADRVAVILSSLGGHNLAFGAHWDFVPVLLPQGSKVA